MGSRCTVPRPNTATSATHEHGDERHPRVERRARCALHGDRREVEPDDRDDRAGDHGRHQPLDPSRSRRHDDEADQRVNDAARDDAAERDADVRVGARARVSRRGDHHADEREARAEVARHAAADDDEEQQRADARTSGSRRWDRSPSAAARAPSRRTSRSTCCTPRATDVPQRQALVGGDDTRALLRPLRKVRRHGSSDCERCVSRARCAARACAPAGIDRRAAF